MKTTVLHIFTIASLALLAMVFSSCTSTETIKPGKTDADKVLSFHKFEDGYRSLYEVSFKDNKIVSIHKDGKKVPDSDMKNYEDLVYKNVDELKSSDPDGNDGPVRHIRINKDKLKWTEKDPQKDKLYWLGEDPVKDKKIFMFRDQDSLLHIDEDEAVHLFKLKMDDFDIDIPDFDMDMKELKKFYIFEDSDSCCKKGSMHHFNFNWDEFNENMKDLKKDIKDKQVYIIKHRDSLFADSCFKKDMKKMKIELQKLKGHKAKVMLDSDKLKEIKEKIRVELSDENLNQQMKELNVQIRKMTDHLKDLDIDKIEIDIPEIEIEIDKLEDKISDLNEKSSGLKIEIKNLGGFTKEIKKELVKDGIIKSEDENFSLSLDSDKITVNDKELPAGLSDKYKDLYTKHFGKQPGKKIQIKINKD